MARRVRIPDDVARVLETYQALGRAARRGLWLAEKQAKGEVQAAARGASALRERLR